MNLSNPARLALEDGTVMFGQAFGATDPVVTEGEVCFNTSLSGYQEILTDPSYAGQIVTMTYPLIGNYGVNEQDLESRQSFVRGFVVRELARQPSNYRSSQRLDHWLKDRNIVGISGIDTRALTRKLRVQGAMKGVLSTDPTATDEQLVDRARQSAGLVGINLVDTVVKRDWDAWTENLGSWEPLQGQVDPPAKRFKVVALDCGAKLNILRNLAQSGCDLTVLPYDASPQQILEHKPEGLFISNGPGDPAAVEPTVSHLKALQGKLPIFGICLGHQLLALSLGADTFKLKFGHRGGNQPVQNKATGKVEITSQNHGFAVDAQSLEKAGAKPSHENLNDGTLEGFSQPDLGIFAAQYHPEAAPGPHDARYLFDCFVKMLETGNCPSAEEMDSAQRLRNDVSSYSGAG